MQVKTQPPGPNITLRILGIDIDCISYKEMMDRFDDGIQNGAKQAFSVALVNVNCCVSALLDPKVRHVYQRADMRGLDGMPFLYLARLLKNRNCDRLYAPDMMLEVAKHSAERGYKFFLYGGAADAPALMAKYLRGRFPHLTVAGMYSPPFRALSPVEDDEVCKMIRDSGANILWVGLGSPKQDVWIEQHRPKLPGVVMIASGATFDFFAGRISQAPKWIQSSGFEWLYRLFQDPVRLWKRYTVYNILFMLAWSLELLGLLRLDSTALVTSPEP